MTDDLPARPLSDLLADASREPGSRRAFLAKLSALSAVLAGCTAREQQSADTARAAGAAAPQTGQPSAQQGAGGAPPMNANSRADTALHHAMPTSSATRGATGGAANATFRRYDPALPAAPPERTIRLEWTAREVPVRISADTVVAAWTFEGDIPGPVVRCRVGDTVEFALRIDGQIPHSMDFHAAQTDPKVSFRSVLPGQAVSFTFKPRFAGAYMYHCGTAPVLMHIGSGMYGAIIVDPPAPLPPAREFVLVQSEYYLGAPANGVRAFDYNKMLATMPDYVAFNGRPGQYMTDPIRVKVGDRVRFYVVNAGPTHVCNFHVVGEQFDTVYLGAPPGTPMRGIQTFGVAPGGGMVFDMLADVPGEFPFVNHGFGHGQKGAIGILAVEA